MALLGRDPADKSGRPVHVCKVTSSVRPPALATPIGRLIARCVSPCAGATLTRGWVVENHQEQLTSRRVVTEDLAVSLVDKRRRGALGRFGEREYSPCDASGGQGREALLCAHMCSAACVCRQWMKVAEDPSVGPM